MIKVTIELQFSINVFSRQKSKQGFLNNNHDTNKQINMLVIDKRSISMTSQ